MKITQIRIRRVRELGALHELFYDVVADNEDGSESPIAEGLEFLESAEQLAAEAKVLYDLPEAP
jgi:hypothetical protein